VGAFSNISRRVTVHWPLDLSVEYKYASGSSDPTGPRSGTFDQLYASQSRINSATRSVRLRNIHNLRSLDTLHIGKSLALNVMYDNYWLASAKDSLYNGQGRSIRPVGARRGWHTRRPGNRYVRHLQP
jgi:hypothetical protein